MAARQQRAVDPVAVAAADADTLHFHMPVVTGAMAPVEPDHARGSLATALAKSSSSTRVARGATTEKLSPCG